MFDKIYIFKNYKKLQKLYKMASEFTNVPDKILAAIHYRECSFSRKSPGPGGPFQFDPPLSSKRIYQLLVDYTNLPKNVINKFVKKGQNNLFVAIVLAGCFIQAKLKFDHKPLLAKEFNSKSNQEVIMRAFELYNGTAYGSAWNSPYVCNMLDAKHQNMVIKGTYIDPRGVRRRVCTTDKRPGAYTIFKLLEQHS